MPKDLLSYFIEEKALNYFSTFLFSITNLLILGFFLVFIPEIITVLKEANPDLTKFEEYSIYTAVILGTGLLRLPFGLLIDSIGYKTVALLIFISVLIGLSLIYFVGFTSYWVDLISAFLIGFAGNIFLVTFTQARDIYSSKYEGTVLGNLNIASISLILILIAESKIVELFQLENILGNGIIALFASFAFYTIYGKENNHSENQNRRHFARVKNLKILDKPCLDSRFVYFSYLYAVTFGGIFLISYFAEGYFSSFFPEQIQLSFGLNTIEFVTIILFGGLLLIPLGGVLSDKYKAVHVLNITLALATFVGFLLGFLGSYYFYLTISGYIFLIFLLSVTISSVLSLISEKTEQKFATMLSLIGTFGSLFIGVIFLILYFILEYTNDYMFVFTIFASIVYGASGIISIKKRTWLYYSEKEISEEKHKKEEKELAQKTKQEEKLKKAQKRKRFKREPNSRKAKLSQMVEGQLKDYDSEKDEKDLFQEINREIIEEEKEKKRRIREQFATLREKNRTSNNHVVEEDDELSCYVDFSEKSDEVSEKSDVEKNDKEETLDSKLEKIEAMEKELNELKKSIKSKIGDN
jgi:nitrate/nitrite transporter NarK